MLAIQIILVVFFLLVLVKVLARWRAKELTVGGAVLWVLFWLAAGVVVILPSTSSYFAGLVGIGRGADLVIYISLAVLFFLVFKLMIRLEHLNKDITELTRQLTLKNK